ncbi:putative ACN9 family domain-containing protein [Mariannaea sp. PMI_226]|nr:putative ACN9 family domain-containing protein [Mariannaea sp. PMI_226]
MQPSATRLAVAATRGLRPNQVALLPPVHLYRRLLRAHRKHLPPEMRLLGDEYIKAEFRAHRNVENPAHMARIGFLTEWQLYAQKIEGESWVGDKLDEGKLAKMSDEQIAQLYELMQAIQKRGQDGESQS